MRVLLVTHYYADHGGGVEVVAAEIAQRLAPQGIELLWAASGPPPAQTLPGVTYLPMRACNLTERWLGIPYPIWGPVSLFRCLRQVRRADAVHVHDCLYLGNVLTCWAARLLGRPVLVTQHIGLVPYRQRWLRGLMSLALHTLGRSVLSGASQVAFCSHSVIDYFASFVRFRRPAAFIPNGVDPELFHPVSASQRQTLREQLGWPQDQPVFLFVGRFVEKKGLAHLRRLAERFPQARWVLIGWGPDDPRGWNLPNVSCPGRVAHADLPPYYQAADLLVLPSVGEGFPLVVPEAMACGTPALISAETARAIPGVEQVTLVSELDAASLEAAIREAVDSPQRLATRRATAAAFAEQHWSWETSSQAYRRLLAEITASEG